MTMAKTKNAFALRDFDKRKILQRPIFKHVEINGEHFLKNNLCSDTEVFESLSPTDDVIQNELNLKKYYAIRTTLLYYQVRLIDRIHLQRLVRFKRATKNPELRKRAENLREEYDEDAMQITITSALVEKEIESLEKTIQQQNRKIFASRLKQARQDKELTQKELATAINMTQGGYVSYEIARREPPLTTLIRLSKTLGRTTDWLLGIGT